MDSRVLEVLNQLIVLIIYGIVFSREIAHQSFDKINTIVTIGGIVFSILLMFFTWFLKTQKAIE
jgi:hypothetical protein